MQYVRKWKKRYYVYALCTNNVPFYIGKGCGNRLLNHLDTAEIARESINADDTLSDDEKFATTKVLSAKLQTILRRKNIQYVLIKWGLSESEAFMCESALINQLKFTYGKKISKLTNVINGHASEAEKASIADVKTKARTLDLFLNECAILQRGIEGIRANVAFFKINETYRQCLAFDGTVDYEKVKDCVRGVWKMDQRRYQSLKYIFALYRGRVVGIFKVISTSKILDTSLETFPRFPKEGRTIDRWARKFSTIEEANNGLPLNDFQKFERALKNLAPRNLQNNLNTVLLNAVLKNWRKRVIFHVDDHIPKYLSQYMNCILTKDGSTRFFNGRHPFLFNF